MISSRRSVYQWGPAAALFILLVVLFSLTGSRTAAKGSGPDSVVYLPAVLVPPPFPEPPDSSVEALVEITPTGGINASTFNPGTFIITNASTGTVQINQVVIDLRTAAFPDLVFDPFGTAGDLVAKDVTIDSDPAIVGFTGHTYSSPHDGGFDVVTLNFNHFDPGEQVAFSVDVDPTSIRGVPAPGPAESGSVSGLEMSGATVLMNFSNSLSLAAAALPVPGSNSGSAALLRENLPVTPNVAVENVPTPPATVSEADQMVLISGGPDWATAVVVVIEGGLFTAGLPNGGFDIDPFEANSAILVNEYRQLVDYEGEAMISITLTKSNDEGGLNHILVYFEDYYGYPGVNYPPIILELTP